VQECHQHEHLLEAAARSSDIQTMPRMRRLIFSDDECAFGVRGDQVEAE
jgi:hypothetical protein